MDAIASPNGSATMDAFPPNWECWLAAEHDAWRDWQAASNERDDAEERLRPFLSDEGWLVAQALVSAFDGREFAARFLIKARLQRLLPQDADLLDWAFQYEPHQAP
ncbi:MAG: hypothetical protein ACR2PL_18940 [Dehalococcoidia bacterium]